MKSLFSFRFFTVALIWHTAISVTIGQSATTGASVRWPLVVSVFNTGTQLPGSGIVGVFTTPIHPGFSVGTEHYYNKNLKNRWFQTARFGFSRHQYVQTALLLYTEAGYRRLLWSGIGAELRIGGGYLHSIPATGLFELKNGVYESKSRIGRPQGMASGTFGLSYATLQRAKPLRFFVDYQFYLQLPFVKSYVPLLPNTALHAGVAIPL